MAVITTVILMTLSVPALTEPLTGCGQEGQGNKTYVLENSTGGGEWVDTSGSDVDCAWSIDVKSPEAVGLVLEFHGINLRLGGRKEREGGRGDGEGGRVVIYQGLHADPGAKLAEIRGSLPVSPLIIYTSQALILLRSRSSGKVAHKPGQYDTPIPLGSSTSEVVGPPIPENIRYHKNMYPGKFGGPPIPHTKPIFSDAPPIPSPTVVRFSFGYEAVPSRTLPPPVSRGRQRRYNCSRPYTVPRALRCDMAQQCVDGRDEADFNCTYGGSCPAGFILEGLFCYTFVFPERSLSYFEAAGLCVAEHNGVPGELPYVQAKRLAAKVTSLSGEEELIAGLKRSSDELKRRALSKQQFYRFLWLWESLAVLELQGPPYHSQSYDTDCAILSIHPVVSFQPVSCVSPRRGGYVCMKGRVRVPDRPRLHAPPWCAKKDSGLAQRFNLQTCFDGSLAQPFHRCSQDSSFSAQQQRRMEMFPIRLFQCASGRAVHYTVICDGVDDCGDFSDEFQCSYVQMFSFKSALLEANILFMCVGSHNLITTDLKCNGHPNCDDGSDEAMCRECPPGFILSPEYGCLPERYDRALEGPTNDSIDILLAEDLPANQHVPRPLPTLYLDGFGSAVVNFTSGGSCPGSHLQCRDGRFVPVYLTDNSVHECGFPNSEDELFTRTACPGTYVCREDTKSLSLNYLCDGVPHCEEGDDELFCNITCPEGCMCEGHEYTCVRMFDPMKHPLVRYLDLSHVPNPPVEQIVPFFFLRFLNLSHCKIQDLSWLHLSLSLLIVLDLSYNEISSLSRSSFQPALLKYFNLSGNHLTGHLAASELNMLVHSKQHLQWLSLFDNQLRQIASKAFSSLGRLTHLDLRKNKIDHIVKDMFYGLDKLEVLLVDSERLCCVFRDQIQRPVTCLAPVDEMSSCEDLLKTTAFRVALWVQSALSLVGNSGVFVFRVCLERRLTSSAFRVLVLNLCMSDVLMGVYISIVGTADSVYRGRYLWEREQWTSSTTCTLTGFLGLVSIEVSALIICLITLDRFLVLRFPFAYSLHLTAKRTLVACGLAWTGGLTLAAVPLLPAFAHWEFYGQTGICLPLPITRHQFPGQAYSFAVFIVLNLILFMLIGAGQVSVYLSIRATSKAGGKGGTDRSRQDTAIARRLFLVVVSDFCCWFPIGVMGLAAKTGTPISEQVNVWAAIFILPLNSALNPFLYTLNSLRARRARRRHVQRVQDVMKHVVAEVDGWPKETLQQVLRRCQLGLKRLERGQNTGTAVNSLAGGGGRGGGSGVGVAES